MAVFAPPGLGWHRDLPDPRDYTRKQDAVAKLLNDLAPHDESPPSVDLREYCAEAMHQAGFAASSVHACLALVQYFERRASGRVIEPSRMFVYRAGRRLLGWSGDSGLPLRVTLKAITRYGLPPERLWPYDRQLLDAEPDAFVFASGAPIPNVFFVRLDRRGERAENTLETVKRFLAAGFAVVFGFVVCTSISADPDIPFPTIFDGIRGGQAAVAVGYDDNRRIRSDRGALRVLNSWGSDWGEGGFGWLPYSYIREQLAVDFWTVIASSWIVSGDLHRPD